MYEKGDAFPDHHEPDPGTAAGLGGGRGKHGHAGGTLPGYLGKVNNSFCWVITSCEIKSDHEATLQLINDFGSEDLTATLTRKNDSIYLFRQGAGNTIKVPNKGKWQKLPKSLEFKRK